MVNLGHGPAEPQRYPTEEPAIMLNRGITHDQPIWNDAGDGRGFWTIHTNTELFGSVQVEIPAKPDATELTDSQRRSLDMLRNLPKSLRLTMVDALKRYARRYLGDCYDPNECDFFCNSASIPYLYKSKPSYVFLNASSDVDEDHGVCFLIRDGDVLACCHSDESFEFYGWDATDDLDALADHGG